MMKSVKIPLSLSLVLTSLGILLCAPVQAQSSNQHEAQEESSNILVIHSYNPNFFWTQETKEGIDQGFQKSDHKTTVFHEFLDAKRYPELHHKDSFLEGIRDKYQHTNLDLLMVADDPGLNLVLKVHQEYFTDLPVVFLGINHVQEEFLNQPWFTGVFETHSVTETIIEAKRQTGGNHLIFIADSSETGEANQKRLKSLEALEGAPENFHILEDITPAEITSKIDSYPDHWPVFIGGQLRKNNKHGPLISYDRGTEMLNASISNPIYTETSALLGSGAVGGKVLDGNYHAQQAVELAERLLSGASPGQVEPILEAKNQWIFDAYELEQAKISLRKLPPGSILINQKLSLYQQNPELVWSAIILLGLSLITIAILSNAIRRQKSAESKLRANEKQLEHKVQERTAELQKALVSLQQSKSETEERSLELAKKNRELNISRRSADKANQAKSDFLAKMSHELRTPLNSILGFTQLLQRDSSLPKQDQSYIDIISASGSHLLNLINNVLDISKVEAGKSQLRKKDFNIESLLESVSQMLNLEASKKGILLYCTCDVNFPEYIHQDESKCKQILINVLGNAVKFTSHGQVSLRAESLQENQLKFTISDTGPGISSQDIEQLFKPFSQAEDGNHHGQGTGLGLAISAEFVKLMGGRIEVRSEPGEGSTFTITIPYETEKITENKNDARDFKASLRLATQEVSKKVLVVDDDQPNRMLWAEILNASNFEVKTAVSGEEAIALSHEWNPHAVLMDVQMPGIDGLEATQIIKREVQPQPIIIVLTTDTQAETKKAAIAAGCDSFLNKPCSIKDLLQELANHLELQFIDESAEFPGSAPCSPQVTPSATVMPVEVSQNLDKLPQMLLQQLLQAASSLSSARLENVLNDLPEGNERLIEHISSLTTNFRYDLVITMLEPYVQAKL